MKNEINKLAELKIPVTIFLIIIVSCIVALILYFIFPTFHSDIKFITLLFGGASGIYSAFYIGKTLELNIERDRIAKSFEFIQRLDCEQYNTVRRFLNHDIVNITSNQLYEKIVENVELDNAIAYVFNNLDDMAIALRAGYLDEDILFDSLSPIVHFWCQKLEPYFIKLREEKNDKTIYSFIQRLYNDWNKRKV